MQHSLRISFDDVSVAETARTWVDYSSRLRSFDIDGGRDSELDEFETTSGTYLLDDRDRELDPTNQESVRWPDVVPNRMLWHRVTDSGVTYDVFKGYVDGFGPEWDESGTGDHRARIRVSDGQKRLTRDTLEAADPDVLDYEDVISSDEPSYYYRLGEPAGTKMVHHAKKKRKRREHETAKHYRNHGFRRWTTRKTRAEAEGISGPAGSYKNTPLLGAPGLIKGDTSTAVEFRSAQSEYALVPIEDNTAIDSNRLTLECWVKPTADTAKQNYVTGPYRAASSSPVFELHRNSSDNAQFHLLFTDGSSISTGGMTIPLTVGSIYHLAGTWDGTTMAVYVNGVLDGTNLTAAGKTARPGDASGNLYIGQDGAGGAAIYADAVIQDVAVYEEALSAERIAAHYEAGTLGFDAATTGGRILQALSLADSIGISALTLSGNEITDTLRASGPTGDGRPYRNTANVYDADDVAQTTLSAGVTNVATTLPITAWQSQWPLNSAFRIFVDQETMIVTAGHGTTSLTVVRGVAQIWGSAQPAAAHSGGAVVTSSMTPQDGWEFKNYAGGGKFSDQAELATTPSGNRALKMTVHPGDYNDGADTTRERIEGYWTGGAGDTGERKFYRWSNEFPADFAANNTGVYIGQLGPNHSAGNPAFFIRVDSQDRFMCGFNTGVLDTGTFVGTFTQQYTFDIPVTKEVRHDFILEVDWELTATGKVNLWHREEGQAWNQLLALSGIITSSSLSGVTPTIKRKHGIYRSANALLTNYLYLYDVIQGDGWEDVQTEPLGDLDSSTGIWPAATNILTNELLTLSGSTVRTSDSTMPLLGAASDRIDFIATNDYIYRTFTGFTIGNVYTCSIWINRQEIDSAFLKLAVRNNANSADQGTVNIPQRKGWQRVTLTFTATDTAGRVRVIMTDATLKPVRAWIGRAQLETGPLANPFVGFSTTRAAARVRVPHAAANSTQSWVAMRVRPGWSPAAEPLLTFERLFDWRVDSSNLVSLFYNESSNNMTIRRQSGGAGSDATQSATGTFNVGEEFTVVAALTATQTKVSVNGAAFSTVSNSSIPNLAAVTSADIGSNSGSSEHVAGDVKWMATGTGTLSDADALALHRFGLMAPLSDFSGLRTWQGSTTASSPWAIMAGRRSMPPARYAGLSPMEIIDDAVAAEGEPAFFHFTASGIATFLDSSYRSLAPYAVSTFGFGRNPGQDAFTYASLDEEDAFLFNIVRGTTDEGDLTFEARDQISIDRFGPSVLALDTLPLGSDEEVQAYIDALLARYRLPLTRVPSIRIESVHALAAVLGLDLGRQVTISIPPPGGGTEITQYSFVERRKISGAAVEKILRAEFGVSPR